MHTIVYVYRVAREQADIDELFAQVGAVIDISQVARGEFERLV